MVFKVIVTGGLGVLGRAVGERFRQEGARVVLVDRAPAPEGDANCVADVDLTDFTQAQTAFAQAGRLMGGVTTLVNVAGGFRFEPIEGGDGQVWASMHALNLTTCLNMSRAAIAGLDDGGSIVNIGAMTAERAGFGVGAYAASKAGVARLTESLAAELAGRIRVNAVLPLMLDTPQNRTDMPDADPAGWTSPQAVADVIVFLASEQARAINGALVPVTAPAR